MALLKDRFWVETAESWSKVSRSLDKDASSSQLLSKPLWFINRMELERNPNIRKNNFIRSSLISLKDVYGVDQRRVLTVNELQGIYGFGHFLT